MNIVKRISINSDFDIVAARMQTREVAKQMGFGPADQARISLAASELARFISWRCHHQSEITLLNVQGDGYSGMHVVCLIDLEYLQNDHKSSQMKDPALPQRSLTGARQLVNESKIEVLDNKLARITLMQWLIKKY